MNPGVAHSIIIHQPAIMDEVIENALAVMAIIAGYLILRRRRERRERSTWRDPFLEPKELSEYHTVMQQLREHNDIRRFEKFIRVSPDFFDNIVRRVGPKIERQDTNICWNNQQVKQRGDQY